jgi:hypothetical protein
MPSELIRSFTLGLDAAILDELSCEVCVRRKITEQTSSRPGDINGLAKLNHRLVSFVFDIEYDEATARRFEMSSNDSRQNETAALVDMNRVALVGHSRIMPTQQ